MTVDIDRINEIIINREEDLNNLKSEMLEVKNSLRKQSVRSLILQGNAHLITSNLNYIKGVEKELKLLESKIKEKEEALSRAIKRKSELDS